MKKPIISVIIPCYNVENYLEQCIDSVVNQSLEEIEIIAVNDGSNDSTLSILNRYKDRDDRVRIIDLPHGGYGKAVNVGMKNASGTYIGIVESDDFIHHDMYKKLYAYSFGNTVDIVKGSFYDYYATEGEVPEAIENIERENVPEIKEPTSLRNIPEILVGHPSIWSAIYRTDFLKEDNIVFQEEKDGGWVDNPFFFETLCKAKKIYWTKEPLYFYRKSNPDSSSKKIINPVLPFERMLDNLEVLKKNNYADEEILRRAYSRALMYLRGSLEECKYEENFDIINTYAKDLMQRLDNSIMKSDFTLHDQFTYYEFASPIKTMGINQPKILLYNWLPFDNPWGWGGGVTVYCRNVIDAFLQYYPNAQIYFISSGFAYMATTTEISYRKIPNIFGERVHQYEIVNSPVPADQRNIYNNPLIALESKELKRVFKQFLDQFGEFSAIHFNNIEGLSLDVFDLKKDYPNTKFIFSIHNYVPMCVTGSYYMRHKHCNCTPEHTGEDCFACVHSDIESKFAIKTYERGLFGQDQKKCISQNRYCKTLGFDRLDQTVYSDHILEFARTATKKINENCDDILAVSKRVYDIAVGEGFDESKMSVSYIGTIVAKRQVRHSLADVKDGLKVVFLGNDLNYEEKGYPWFLDTLEKLEQKYASKIDLVLTTRNAEHAEIYTMCKKFRSVKVIQGYTHKDLEWILAGCNLGIVPVLWEDNLPQIAIEMVAYGVPVLASSAGGATELCDSELFKFEAGNSEEFLNKLVHFLEKPEDLNEYWRHHTGLVTMKEHLKELIKLYGLPEVPEAIRISSKDYAYLLMENEFLRKNISLNEEKFVPDPVVEELRKKLREANDRNQMLEKELEEEKMANFSGKVTFQTDYDPIQGPEDTIGANLFKLVLDKFDYSDFYAEIEFIKMMNVNKSYMDILRISGTWHNESGEYRLYIHNAEFEKNEKEIVNSIFCYTRENEVYFFGKHPIKYCGYAWKVINATSRAIQDPITFKNIHVGFIEKNELRPDNVVEFRSEV